MVKDFSCEEEVQSAMMSADLVIREIKLHSRRLFVHLSAGQGGGGELMGLNLEKIDSEVIGRIDLSGKNFEFLEDKNGVGDIKIVLVGQMSSDCGFGVEIFDKNLKLAKKLEIWNFGVDVKSGVGLVSDMVNGAKLLLRVSMKGVETGFCGRNYFLVDLRDFVLTRFRAKDLNEERSLGGGRDAGAGFGGSSAPSLGSELELKALGENFLIFNDYGCFVE